MSTCFHHPEVEAVGFCRQCGKALCGDCKRDIQGMFYCEPCLAANLTGTPAAGTEAGTGAAGSSASDAPNPVIAACIGCIPGFGAIYNGEIQKAVIYISIFAGAIALLNSNIGDGMRILIALFIPGFIFYMIMDSYQVAKARSLGAPAPPPSSWEMPEWSNGKAAPIGPLILIGLGGLFLMNNFLPFQFHIFRFWPLALIGFGAYLIWQRIEEKR